MKMKFQMHQTAQCRQCGAASHNDALCEGCLETAHVTRLGELQQKLTDVEHEHIDLSLLTKTKIDSGKQRLEAAIAEHNAKMEAEIAPLEAKARTLSENFETLLSQIELCKQTLSTIRPRSDGAAAGGGGGGGGGGSGAAGGGGFNRIAGLQVNARDDWDDDALLAGENHQPPAADAGAAAIIMAPLPIDIDAPPPPANGVDSSAQQAPSSAMVDTSPPQPTGAAGLDATFFPAAVRSGHGNTEDMEDESNEISSNHPPVQAAPRPTDAGAAPPAFKETGPGRAKRSKQNGKTPYN